MNRFYLLFCFCVNPRIRVT